MTEEIAIYTIHPDLMLENWEIGQTVKGYKNLDQYYVVDQDETGKEFVILRKLPLDERVNRDQIIGELKAEPNRFQRRG